MSREIKFRAWDCEFKTMCYGSIGQDRWYSKTGFLDVSSGGLEGCEIMNYTGEKDASNSEVYEGDIFKDVFSDNYGVVTYGEYTHCFDDKRLSDFGAHVGFYVKFNVPQPRKDLKYWVKNQSVVGNIHANPDLI